jgi:hypothetical protein
MTVQCTYVAFNKRGDVERITSFDSASSGNVVTEVFVRYNGLGQAIETLSSHAGNVRWYNSRDAEVA